MINESNKQLNPEWKISHTEKNKTGVRLFGVEHPNPEFPTSVWLAEPNSEFDVTSVCAWVAARTSRTQQEYDDAFSELKQAMEKNPDLAAQKVANVFEGYGHASPADMAPIFIYMNQVPIYQAYEIFHNISVGAGQETSTRFIEFDNLMIDSPELLLPMENVNSEDQIEIKEKWESIQNHLKLNYYDWIAKASQVYKEKFPNTSERTLNARVFDIARLWIPMGARTSMSLLMSVRNWIDMVKVLRQSTDISNNVLGEQILQSLSLSNTEEGKDIQLKLGSFLKYNTPSNTVPENLEKLGKYLSSSQNFIYGKKTLFDVIASDCSPTSIEYFEVENALGTALQYVLTIHPELDAKPLITWLQNLSEDEKIEIGEIIFEDHNNHNQLSTMGDIRSSGLFEMITSFAYLRDLNRHKATGRFTDVFLSPDPLAILKYGFNLNHQVFNTEGFEELRDDWRQKGEAIVQELRDLANIISRVFPEQDSRWLLRLLPLGYNTRFHISGPIKQLHYLTDLRSQRGGDFGYVVIAEKMIELMKKNSFLKKAFKNSVPLDLESISEFQSRK